MVDVLERMGFEVEAAHHEVAHVEGLDDEAGVAA
jgi:hypothetical protein